jgi:hypothetical protein
MLAHKADGRHMLLRCACGKLLWRDSPNDVKAQHVGHGELKAAIQGTWWEMLKLKLGLIK